MSTWVTQSLPLPVIGTVGSMVSLPSILAMEFGSSFSVSTGYWLTYDGSSFLQSNNFSYWIPSSPSVTSWYVNGQNIGESFSNQTHVPLSQIGGADLNIGNDICPAVFLTFPVSIPPTTYAVNVQYNFAVVPPNLVSPTIASGIVNPADIVASAERYAAQYSGTPNTSDCWNIAYDVASAAGAPLPIPSGSNDPTQNVDGGFWRVVYRGSEPNLVANWQTLVQPGDTVRMVWANGTPVAPAHTTTVLSVNSDGSITVFDNSASKTGSIGIHTVNYDLATVASSITIYRLSPDHLYLINGIQGETLTGSPFNNEFNAVSGDVVNCGPGNDVVNVGSGPITINGGAGQDTAVFSTTFASSQITDASGHPINIVNGLLFDAGGAPIEVSSGGSTDTLTSVNNLKFADQTITVFTGTFSPTTIQNDYLGITRITLPIDQAVMVANAISAGTQTETQYVNGLLSQVANTAIPAVAVEASMYGVTGSSAEITKLITQYLPAQVANATQHGYNPQVYASEALGLAFAFGNENGSTAFSTAFGPSNAAMPNSTSGDSAFAVAAANTIFGAASTANLVNVMQGFVANWKGFYSSNGVPAVSHATADQIDLAARGAAWGDAVGVALANNIGPLAGQTTNFLEDAAQGTAVYSASLTSQPTHAAFHGPAYGLYGAFLVKGASRHILSCCCFILLFDPRREHSSVPDGILPSPSRTAMVKDGAFSAPPKACP